MNPKNEALKKLKEQKKKELAAAAAAGGEGINDHGAISASDIN